MSLASPYECTHPVASEEGSACPRTPNNCKTRNGCGYLNILDKIKTRRSETYVPLPLHAQVFRSDRDEAARPSPSPDHSDHPGLTAFMHKIDIKQHPVWMKVGKWITHLGFAAKCFLYCVIGVTAIVCGSKRGLGQPAVGLTQAIVQISTFGTIVLLATIMGLFTYTLWTLLYGIFDFDRLGHRNAIMVLKRFGQIVSGCIYTVLGVNGCQLLLAQYKSSGAGKEIFVKAMNNDGGKVILVLAGLALEVIALVSVIDAWRGIKYKMLLRSEHMGRKRFLIFVNIGRLGAVGRALSFGILGGFLFETVIYKDTAAASGLAGVFNSLAFNVPALLIILGIGLVFYSLWAGVLAAYRRVPAWPNAREAEAHLNEEREGALPVVVKDVITKWTSPINNNQEYGTFPQMHASPPTM